MPTTSRKLVDIIGTSISSSWLEHVRKPAQPMIDHGHQAITDVAHGQRTTARRRRWRLSARRRVLKKLMPTCKPTTRKQNRVALPSARHIAASRSRRRASKRSAADLQRRAHRPAQRPERPARWRSKTDTRQTSFPANDDSAISRSRSGSRSSSLADGLGHFLCVLAQRDLRKFPLLGPILCGIGGRDRQIEIEKVHACVSWVRSKPSRSPTESQRGPNRPTVSQAR